MRYLRSGTGPPLLLVHGLLGYSFSWRFAMPVFAQQATVYAVDMLGAGFSDRPARLDCTLRASAQRLLRFLDAVGVVSSCDLLGTSHGGAVAMMAAALAPDRIRRLILVAPVNPWSAHGKLVGALLSSSAISPLFLRMAPHLRGAHRFVLRRLVGDMRRIRPGTLEGYSAPFIAGAFDHPVATLRSWNRDLQELKSVLPRIGHIPTLLVWGSLDTAVSPDSARQLGQLFKDCQMVMFDGVWHLPYEEMPEEFNRAVAEFLSRNRPGSL
jgi:pimeloyl-ACP methyl ester carboxylesterase